MVIAIKIQINLYFYVAKNAVTVEDIIEMHSVGNMLTEAERYNASIWRHYIEWALKTRLEYLNEVNNGYTCMKCFTQGCHNMTKSDCFKIFNVKTVHKFHVLFRVEYVFPPLRKDKRQLTYYLVANWDIAKAIQICDQ